MKRFYFPLALAAIVLAATVAVHAGLVPAEVSAMSSIGGLILCDPTAAPASKVTEEALQSAITAMREANDNVKKLAADAQKELESGSKLNAETRKAVDDALVKLSGLAATVNDIEQKLVRRASGPSFPDTPGHAFINSDVFKAIGGSDKVERGRQYRVTVPHASLRMDAPIGSRLAAVTSLGTAGNLVEEMRVPGILELPRRRLTVRNLLAPGRTSSNAFKYVRETGFTNNAAVVSETTMKPESDITFDVTTGNVATIAHWIRASRQILDDAPGLQSMIDARLRYGLQLEEEAQLLRGDGTGDNLSGIITQASAYNPAILTVPDETRIDEIRKAILQVFLAEYPATGIVMHPTDWAAIELTKTTDGAYIMANPAGNLQKTLWGLPVVDTQAMNTDEFLVGAFSLAAQIFDREDANVAVSTEDRDNFVKNMVTILAEERLALAVYRPEAMVTGNFASATI